MVDEDRARLHAGEGAVGPERDRAQVVVVADAGEHEVAPGRRLARGRRAAPPCSATQASAFAAVRCRRATLWPPRSTEMSRHRVAHYAQAQKRDFAQSSLLGIFAGGRSGAGSIARLGVARDLRRATNFVDSRAAMRFPRRRRNFAQVYAIADALRDRDGARADWCSDRETTPAWPKDADNFSRGSASPPPARACATPALADAAPDIEWRLTSSFVPTLDLIYGGAETFAQGACRSHRRPFHDEDLARGRNRAGARRARRRGGRARRVRAYRALLLLEQGPELHLRLLDAVRHERAPACGLAHGRRRRRPDRRIPRRPQDFRAARRQHRRPDGGLVPQGSSRPAGFLRA